MSSDIVTKAILKRPAEEYLTGYEVNGKWVPGVLENIQTLFRWDSWMIRGLFALGILKFLGVDDLASLIELAKHIVIH